VFLTVVEFASVVCKTGWWDSEEVVSGWDCMRLLTCRADAPVTAYMWENALYDDMNICG